MVFEKNRSRTGSQRWFRKSGARRAVTDLPAALRAFERFPLDEHVDSGQLRFRLGGRRLVLADFFPDFRLAHRRLRPAMEVPGQIQHEKVHVLLAGLSRLGERGQASNGKIHFRKNDVRAERLSGVTWDARRRARGETARDDVDGRAATQVRRERIKWSEKHVLARRDSKLKAQGNGHRGDRSAQAKRTPRHRSAREPRAEVVIEAREKDRREEIRIVRQNLEIQRWRQGHPGERDLRGLDGDVAAEDIERKIPAEGELRRHYAAERVVDSAAAQ